MKAFLFWQRWLLASSLFTAALGIFFAVFSGSGPMNWLFEQLNPAFWGATEVSSETVQFQRWIHGVLGATLAGWGIMMSFVAYHPFRAKERWSWNCLAIGLTVWFAVDTVVSLYFRVHFNAALNAVMYFLAAIPLAATRKVFASQMPRAQ